MPEYYMFAYDISDSKRRNKLRRLLSPWRIDGQLSVHELLIGQVEYKRLRLSIESNVNALEDSLLSCHLSTRGLAAVYQPVAKFTNNMLLNQHISYAMPVKIQDGVFIISYNIADTLRLRKVYRLISKYAIQLQRSVYLYQGAGCRLQKLMSEVISIAKQGEDDLRLYSLSERGDLQFIAEPQAVCIF